MIKVILWDIDATLLNFKMAEKAAIQKCFDLFHLGICTDEMLARYSVLNAGYWKRLETGELKKEQVLVGRFEEFFQKEQIDFHQYKAFNDEYQYRLGDTICFNDNGYELVRQLKGQVKQYIVTNGTYVAQKRKLERSGLEELVDGVFISDQIGIEKPNIGFFDAVWKEIGHYERDEVVIIGDSLTSDMRGGNNVDILCCWYNPEGLSNDLGVRIDYEIRSLQEIPQLFF
jgi:2-haloacid dehalogenase